MLSSERESEQKQILPQQSWEEESKPQSLDSESRLDVQKWRCTYKKQSTASSADFGTFVLGLSLFLSPTCRPFLCRRTGESDRASCNG